MHCFPPLAGQRIAHMGVVWLWPCIWLLAVSCSLNYHTGCCCFFVSSKWNHFTFASYIDFFLHPDVCWVECIWWDVALFCLDWGVRNGWLHLPGFRITLFEGNAASKEKNKKDSIYLMLTYACVLWCLACALCECDDTPYIRGKMQTRRTLCTSKRQKRTLASLIVGELQIWVR